MNDNTNTVTTVERQENKIGAYEYALNGYLDLQSTVMDEYAGYQTEFAITGDPASFVRAAIANDQLETIDRELARLDRDIAKKQNDLNWFIYGHLCGIA